MDLKDDKQLKQVNSFVLFNLLKVYKFLAKHYVSNESLRFHYSEDFIRWAVTVPG